MQTPPRDLDETALLDVVRSLWAPGAGAVDYLPVGYGSHHWAVVDAEGSRWFVSADAAATAAEAERLAAAFAVPGAAGAAGVAGAHGPVPGADGRLVHRLGGWLVSVQPWVDGRAGAFHDRWSDAEAEEVVRLLAGLHALPLDRVGVAREDLRVPGRHALEEALATVGAGRALAGGPLAAEVGALLQRHEGAVARVLAGLDAAGPDDPARLVLTHGEPHPGNVVWTSSGPALVDWDTARAAEPERDLWLVAGRTRLDVVGRYAELTGRTLDTERMQQRAVRWAVTDVAGYVPDLAAALEEDDDTAWQLRALRTTLEELSRPGGPGVSG